MLRTPVTPHRAMPLPKSVTEPSRGGSVGLARGYLHRDSSPSGSYGYSTKSPRVPITPADGFISLDTFQNSVSLRPISESDGRRYVSPAYGISGTNSDGAMNTPTKSVAQRSASGGKASTFSKGVNTTPKLSSSFSLSTLARIKDSGCEDHPFIVHPFKSSDDVFIPATKSVGRSDPVKLEHNSQNDVAAFDEATSVIVNTSDNEADDDDNSGGCSLSKPAPPPRRSAGKLSGENAQAYLPPQAAIFVGNLPRVLTYPELQKQLTSVFTSIGKCYIKVRYNEQNNTPHAFVQFEQVDHASEALELGLQKKLKIGSRIVRTERALASRTIFVHKQTCVEFGKHAVRELLKDCGPIRDISRVSHLETLMHKLPPGFLVTFEYYQDAIQAQAAKRNHPEFRVGPIPGNHGSHGSNARSASTNPAPRPNMRNLGNQTVHEVLYVGNLPYSATNASVWNMFACYGRVVETHVLHSDPLAKPPRYKVPDGQYIVEALVYYGVSGAVDKAVYAMNRSATAKNLIVQPAQGVPYAQSVPNANRMFQNTRTEPNGTPFPVEGLNNVNGGGFTTEIGSLNDMGVPTSLLSGYGPLPMPPHFFYPGDCAITN